MPFSSGKKCTQHETKERSKISLTHCQATVPFPTTPCSFFKHKDVCHMVNERKHLEKCEQTMHGVGKLGSHEISLFPTVAWESVPISLAESALGRGP